MKAVLARFARQKAIGLCIGDREITLSQVANTPVGPVEVARRQERYEPDQLSAALQQLLRPFLGRRKLGRPAVALGLSPLKVFFSTRPIRAANSNTTPQVLLHEMLRSPTLNLDEMLVEVIKAEPDKRKVASIVACRKKYLHGLLNSLEGCGVSPARAEPDPCALLRAAAAEHRAPRKAKAVLRIFLGERQGLAVAVAGSLPLIWRPFDLPAGGEGPALQSAMRSLETLVKFCGVDQAPEVIMLHGRPDLQRQFGGAALQTDVDRRIAWFKSPPLAPERVAFGLALGCFKPPGEGFDLTRTLKPPASFKDIFPWGEVVVQVLMLVGMALFLWYRSTSLQEDLERVQAENARRPWLAATAEPQLEKEKKDLGVRVDAIQRFLGSRILWTPYTHDVAARLPANARLGSFQGVAELEQIGPKKEGGGKPKKSLVLKALAPIPKDGQVPQEIDGFVRSLRGHPLLQRDFPVVELAAIRALPETKDSASMAVFTVVALPAPDKAANPGAARPAADARKGGK